MFDYWRVEDRIEAYERYKNTLNPTLKILIAMSDKILSAVSKHRGSDGVRALMDDTRFWNEDESDDEQGYNTV